MITTCSNERKKQLLLKYYKNLTLEVIPKKVFTIAKKCLLDTITCGIGGRNTFSSKTVLDMCRVEFPGEESTIWANGEKLSSIGAAFVNGTMASDLDIDDGNRSALGHPGSVIIPACIAIAEKENIPVRQLMEGIILGYDIAIRFGEVLLRNEHKRFYGSGTWAIVGAVAGLCKMTRCDGDLFLSGLGVAEAYASLSPVMKSIQNGSNTKETIGWASFSAVPAFELTKRGFMGVVNMLFHEEESEGYEGLDDLGTEFKITKTYFKRYSSCRWSHGPIEAMLKLKKTYGFSVCDVKSIIVKTHEKAMSLNTVEPKNYIQAEYSIPFTLANIIVHGHMGPNQLISKNLSDKRILSIARKVRLEHSSKCQALFPDKSTAEVTVTLNDGQALCSKNISPKGDWDDPLLWEDICIKFHDFAKDVWSPKKQAELLKKVNFLEDYTDISTRELFL